MKKVILAVFVLLTITIAHAQYHIDSTFNGTGTNEFVEYAGNVVNGKQVAYSTDNNLVIAGRWNTNLTIWKYLQNGNMDLSFGTNGITYFDLSIYNTDVWVIVKDLKIQDNGKIIVLADRLINSSNIDYCQSAIVLARLNPDGTPDSSFNNTGVLITKPDGISNYDSRCLDIDNASGQIYVGGTVSDYGAYSCPYGTGAWFVANFTETGEYDATFNSSGYLQETANDLSLPAFTAQTPMSLVFDVKALPNDRLFFAGAFNNIDHAMYTARLNADGSYDNSYAGTGKKALQDFAHYGFPSNGYTVATILEDESTVFHVNMPSITNADSVNSVIYKFNSSGDPDLTFGTNGVRRFNELGSTTRVTLDTNGRLIYCWYNYPTSTEQHMNFRRLLPDGSNDLSFGYEGYYQHLPVANETHFSASYVEDMAINPQNNDLTVIAYRSANYAPNGTFRILNYQVDNVVENLSIETLADAQNIQLYPNPGNGNLTVETDFSCEYSLLNANGSLITSGKLQAGTTHFDWSEQLMNGIYFLQVKTETEGYSTLKISIQK